MKSAFFAWAIAATAFAETTVSGVSVSQDADSGKVIGHAPKVTLDLAARSTVWLFMR